VTIDALLEHLADLVAEKVAARLNGHHAAAPDAPDRMLTVPEVAQRLRASRRFVYAHRKALGGVALSKRALRFPEAAVDRYLARRP